MADTPRPVVDPALLNGAGAATRWANLGYWRVSEPEDAQLAAPSGASRAARSYAEAAATLARRVGRAIALGADDVVVDVGCGEGDSVLLWLREFGVRRVVGVEPDAAVVAAANARLRAAGLSSQAEVVQAKAEEVSTSLLPLTSLSSPSPSPSPSILAPCIICLDAAYHFTTRRTWLTDLARAVPPGTRLGLADLLVTRQAMRGTAVRRFAARAGIPEANLWTAHDVEPLLADCGWALDRMVRCGPEVLGGFARFAARSAARLALAPRRGGWRALGTAAAIAALGVGTRLDYAIISARRI